MTEFFQKFSLQNIKMNGTILGMALLIWLIVLGCVITSIVSQPFTSRQRTFWIAVVVLVPIIGLLCYLPFSFRREELPQIMLMKRDRQKRRAALKAGTKLQRGRSD